MHLSLFYFPTNFYSKSVTGFFVKDVSSVTASFTATEKAQAPGAFWPVLLPTCVILLHKMALCGVFFTAGSLEGSDAS